MLARAKEINESPGRNGPAPVPIKTVPFVTLGAPELGSSKGRAASNAPFVVASNRSVPSEPGTATTSSATAGGANENAGKVVSHTGFPDRGSSATATQVPAVESFESP